MILYKSVKVVQWTLYSNDDPMPHGDIIAHGSFRVAMQKKQPLMTTNESIRIPLLLLAILHLDQFLLHKYL